MVTKDEKTASEPKKAQPKASDAKKVTKKTESAAEIDVVQEKKKIPVKRVSNIGKARIPLKKAKKPTSRDIGIPMNPPSKRCEDPNCPFHGTLSLRGIILDAQVVSRKMDKTVVVKKERVHFVEKYQRYEKRTSRYLAHHPPCIEFEVGDMVRIMECRPLSKGVNFTVLGRV